MAGLPRSGSTLLSALLNQNPEIYCSTNSPLLKTLYQTKECLLESEQYQANPIPDCLKNVLESIPQSYYKSKEEHIIIDKSRAWTGHIDLIKECITEDPKIICPVRNIIDILTSFVYLQQNDTNHKSFISKNLSDRNLDITSENICNHLMGEHSLIGGTLSFLKNADHKHILFVEYDDLIKDPQSQMNKIYDFLGLPTYGHDFTNIIQEEVEDPNNTIFGFKDMHVVRKTINKIEKNPKVYLDAHIIDRYSNMEFWRNKTNSIEVFGIGNLDK